MVFNQHMSMSTGSNDRLEMNIMWAAMGLMFIFDVGMFYFHIIMHKRLEKIEERLAVDKK
jgi:hypothetical protein